MNYKVNQILNFSESSVYFLDSLNRNIEILIKEIKLIKIITTDQGPFVNDLFVIIQDMNDNEYEIPSDIPTFQKVFDLFDSLPSFNYEEFIKSQSSTDYAEFICYKN